MTATITLEQAVAAAEPVTLTVSGLPDDIAMLLRYLILRWPASIPADVPDDMLPKVPGGELSAMAAAGRAVIAFRGVGGEQPWEVRHALRTLLSEVHATGSDCVRCGARRGTWCRTSSERGAAAHIARRAPVIRERS